MESTAWGKHGVPWRKSIVEMKDRKDLLMAGGIYIRGRGNFADALGLWTIMMSWQSKKVPEMAIWKMDTD